MAEVNARPRCTCTKRRFARLHFLNRYLLNQIRIGAHGRGAELNNARLFIDSRGCTLVSWLSLVSLACPVCDRYKCVTTFHVSNFPGARKFRKRLPVVCKMSRLCDEVQLLCVVGAKARNAQMIVRSMNEIRIDALFEYHWATYTLFKASWYSELSQVLRMNCRQFR